MDDGEAVAIHTNTMRNAIHEHEPEVGAPEPVRAAEAGNANPADAAAGKIGESQAHIRRTLANAPA